MRLIRQNSTIRPFILTWSCGAKEQIKILNTETREFDRVSVDNPQDAHRIYAQSLFFLGFERRIPPLKAMRSPRKRRAAYAWESPSLKRLLGIAGRMHLK